MESNSWLTVDDIMKDLCMPRKTSKRLDRHFIVKGKKPPRNLTGTEETEEEYIGQGTTGDEVSTPDLGLIKQMLDIVNDAETCYKESNTMNKGCVIEISKMKPLSKKFAIINQSSGDVHLTNTVVVEPTKKEKKKPRHSRNAALTSILQNMTESEREDIMNDNDNLGNNMSSKVNMLETKLLKPTDFMNSKKCLSSLSPTNMFRRKQKTCLSPEKDDQDNKGDKSAQSSPSSCSNAYVPSSFAQEKYKEYMNRNTIKNKDTVVKNYWEGIMQQMKQIDSKRSLEVDVDRSNHPQLTDEEFKRFGPVLLPMHRHHLKDDCIVCVLQSEREPDLPKMVTSTPEILSQ